MVLRRKVVAPKSTSLVQTMLLYFQIHLDTAPEKLMTCRVRTQTTRKACQAAMSDSVGATAGVTLASDTCLAFKPGAAMERQAITAWSRSCKGPRTAYAGGLAFEGWADNTHECTGMVVGAQAQPWAATAEDRLVVFMQGCGPLWPDLQIFQEKPEF